MTPNHPYSMPVPHTWVTLFLSSGEQVPGYHDGGQFWFVETGEVELRVDGWEA